MTMFQTTQNSRPRLALGRRAIVNGALGLVLLGGAACRAKAYPGDLSVRDLGARGDGRSDDTRAFQTALDRLGGGGVLRVPPGRYRVDQVAVRHRGIRVQLDAGAVLVKHGAAGVRSRGIFVLDGLHDARFELVGGTVDLNGEGPRAIGTPGRIPNQYSHLTIASVRGISGPANAAIFARRSSDVAVSGVHILNSGESGLLFRNCGRVTVRDCVFDNIANYGIELSLTVPEADGGSGAMPLRNDVSITGCRFNGMDDYALGSGNGGGIGGGGAGTGLGALRNYRISDCRFERCHRDIHFEFLRGSWLEQFAFERLRSIEPRQGSIGLVGARHGVISDVTIEDPGSAPAALLIPARPEIFGIVLSQDFSDILLRNIAITDRRTGRQFEGGGATIDRGSSVLTVNRPAFEPDDAGRWIGIAGGNPGQAAYVGRIDRVASASRVELDLPAGASVRGGRFAVGGTARNGIILNGGGNVTFENVRVAAGNAGDAQGANDAAAIRLQDTTGTIRFSGVDLAAPGGRWTKPAGLLLVRNRARLVGADGIRATGFARARSELR
ncbi:right-handed parallel beta-helix repeat-containing protein [Tsuneonella sp. SYSU-LHT278]|uniref:right-handed parallel beta-helix repeat-containing protein n=1 Tax=Tsuneonella sediminis TaxID=3416089 RepID=UPI003F78FA3E